MDKLVVLFVVGLCGWTLGQQRPLEPCSQLLSENSHQGNVWRARLNLPVKRAVARWQATLRFSKPVTDLSSTKASHSTADMRVFVLRAYPNSKALPVNSTYHLDIQVTYSGSPDDLSIESVHFDGTLVCNETSPGQHQRIQLNQYQVGPTQQQNKKRFKYHYELALSNSILFYEAQRSGLLPEDNRIPWRNDSCVNDRGLNGEDLSGGYYTNGRTLKFTFPTAAAMTIMAWGILNHEDGYEKAGQTNVAKDALHWGASYLERCHTGQNQLYALVGNVHKEIVEWWGRPEDINFQRPASLLTDSNPGSEVAAETAAALAASSIIFPETAVRSSLLNHAKQLFNFATNYRGDYSVAVPQVVEFYKNWSGDEDELVWAALWLYRATGQESYLQNAKSMYRSFKLGERNVQELSWDDKTLAVRILLASYTLDDMYARDAEKVCNSQINNPSLKTPQGMFNTGQQVGNIRYTSNFAFACFELGEVLVVNRGLATNPYLDFAVRQVNFILGDAGRSYMVGFGHNPPKRVQHSAASCPMIPAECGWRNKNSSAPNPHVVLGALVGGPDQDGTYEDSRDNWRQNDVGVDYNAGFQSLLAAIIKLHHQGKLPPAAYASTY